MTIITNKISDQSVKLKKIRLYLGMTREKFGEKLGISQYTIRSWENGAKNFGPTSVARVIKELDNKIKFSCSFDWMIYGTGDSPITLYEEKAKFQEDDIKFDILQEGLLKEVITFKTLNKNASVIIVSDDRFSPLANPGDYVGIMPIELKNAKAYLGNIAFFIDEKENNIFGVLTVIKKAYHINPLNRGALVKLNKMKNSKLFLLIWFRKLL